MQIDEDVFDPGVGGIGNSALDLNGSIGILNIGSFKTWTVEITGHTQNASSDDVITYNTSDIGTYKDKHHYYFFEGKLSFLDTNNEWFHDKSDNTLYLYPDYGDLSNRTIKGKTTDYSVTFSGAKYVSLKKINFFATTFEMTGDSDYNTIEECNFYYPSASKRMLGTTNGLGTPNVTELGSNADNNTIEKCLFENTEGEALVIKGDSNTIKNNYFHHIDWSASELQGLMVSIYITGQAIHFIKTPYTQLEHQPQFSLEECLHLAIIKSQTLDFYNPMVLFFKGQKTMLRDRWYITTLFMILKNMHFDMMHRVVMQPRQEVMVSCITTSLTIPMG